MRITRASLITALLITVALLATGFFTLRAGPDERISALLAAYGFNTAKIDNVVYRDGYIVNSHITLDPAGFSTISDIQIPARYLDYIFHTHPRIVTINALKLAGELNSENGLSIEGWRKTPFPHPLTDLLVLGSGQLDLLTSAGALRFEGKGEIAKNADGIAELKAAVWATQHQLEAETLWDGRLLPDGGWYYEIEIQSASLDFKKLQASRVSGWLVLDKTKSLIPAISGQLDAGKLTFGEIDLMNARLTLSGPLAKYKLLGNGKVGDYENMAFTLEVSNRTEGPHVMASIETASLTDLIGFLKDLQKSDPATGNLTALLLTQGNLNRLQNNLKNIKYDLLELQIYGPLYDLAGKVIAKQFKDGVIQNNVISLDPGIKAGSF